MKRRQEIALADPCTYAEDTIAHNFHERRNGFSSILTVNK